MELLARNDPHGMKIGEPAGRLDKQYVFEWDPTSPRYRFPTWWQGKEAVNGWCLAEWLTEIQQRRGGRVPPFPLTVNIKHANALIAKKYDKEDILRATHYAAIVTERSFSFKLVKRILDNGWKIRAV